MLNTGGKEEGVLSINTKSIAFRQPPETGKAVFSVPPAEVSVKALAMAPVAPGTLPFPPSFRLQVGKKNYTFTSFPFAGNCSLKDQVVAGLKCPPEATREQEWVSSYVSRTIPRLASTASSHGQ
jgi:hypothetical protein